MALSFLGLKDFRNYSRLELHLKPGLSLFYGGNAQGKTNLLEACFYLSSLTSPRAEKDGDLARWGTGNFSLAGRVENGGTVYVTVDVSVLPSLRKKVQINDRVARRQELSSALPCVYFSPDDLYMVKKSSSLRRKFLDSILCRIDGTYARDLSRYEDTLARRNATLKRVARNPSWNKALEPLDNMIVTYGSSVLYGRLSLMESLAPDIQDTYAFISGGHCQVSYWSSIGQLETDRGFIQETFASKLKAMASDELVRGITLTGPHRDDISITFGDKTFRYFGSQGQQRSVALALRMAEARSLEGAFRKKPVLLLDDVLSELDTLKREKVLSLCDFGHQVLITATDPVLSLDRPVNLFQVTKNTVVPH